MTTPIADFIARYVRSDAARLHMPGHKGRGLPEAAFDITEIEGADALYEADGVIAESEVNAAAIFGTGRTAYSTEGSSQCIRAMLYLAATYRGEGMGRFALAGRNAHKTFVHAAALCGFDAMWLYPEGEQTSPCACPISPERLDEAVRHVLAMQHKLTLLPKDAAITPEDEERFTSITRDGFAAVTDEGISPTISRDGRHFFVLLEENLGLAPGQTVPEISVATFSSRWYQPDPIEEKIRAVFPNSTVRRLNEFPTEQQNLRVLEEECAWDDVVFVTFNRGNAYQGAEHFTSRVLSVIEAMQVTNRVSAILHFGNPFLLEETVHIPRRFLGSASRQSTLDGIEVLAGLYPASGTIPYDLKLR